MLYSKEFRHLLSLILYEIALLKLSLAESIKLSVLEKGLSPSVADIGNVTISTANATGVSAVATIDFVKLSSIPNILYPY
jgi:hypothetical protein